MESRKNFDYKIGQLAGQISALIDSNKNLTDSLRRLEEKFEKALDAIESRVDENIKDTIALKIKMSLIGGISGLLGGVLVSYINHIISK